MVGKRGSKGIQAAMGGVQSLGMDRSFGPCRKERVNEYGLGVSKGNVVGRRTCGNICCRGDSDTIIGQ